MVIKCNYCNIICPTPSKYSNHITTAKHIKNIQQQKTSSTKHIETYRNKQNQIDNNTNKSNLGYQLRNYNLDKYTCPYCLKEFKTNNGFRKHIRNTCIVIPKQIKQELINKHNRNTRTKNYIEKDKVIKSVTINNNIINNIQNNIYKNEKNNKEYLIMNPIGKESIEHFTDKDKLDIVNSRGNFYNTFINKLYKNPSNHNFMLENKNKNLVKYINQNKKLQSGKLNIMLKRIISHNMDNIDDIYHEVKSILNTIQDIDINAQMNKYYDSDKDFCKKMEDDLYMKLININNVCKTKLENIIEENEELMVRLKNK